MNHLPPPKYLINYNLIYLTEFHMVIVSFYFPANSKKQTNNQTNKQANKLKQNKTKNKNISNKNYDPPVPNQSMKYHKRKKKTQKQNKNKTNLQKDDLNSNLTKKLHPALPTCLKNLLIYLIAKSSTHTNQKQTTTQLSQSIHTAYQTPSQHT